MFATQEQDTR